MGTDNLLQECAKDVAIWHHSEVADIYVLDALVDGPTCNLQVFGSEPQKETLLLTDMPRDKALRLESMGHPCHTWIRPKELHKRASSTCQSQRGVGVQCYSIGSSKMVGVMREQGVRYTS